MNEEIYVSVDVECLGKHPIDYALASIGACVVGDCSKQFYVELKPDKQAIDLESLKVCGFSIKYLEENGVEPRKAMQKFETWLQKLGGRPIFVGFPLGFDRMWIYCYFKKYLGRDPFGKTCNGVDIKTYAMVKLKTLYSQTTKKHLKNLLGDWGGKHTHNALDDAIEQAKLFEMLLKL